MAAVSAIVFSPRPASVIGGFISRTKNPKISTWTIQNALFSIHKSKDTDLPVNFMDTCKHVPLRSNNNLCQFRNLRFLLFHCIFVSILFRLNDGYIALLETFVGFLGRGLGPSRFLHTHTHTHTHDCVTQHKRNINMRPSAAWNSTEKCRCDRLTQCIH